MDGRPAVPFVLSLVGLMVSTAAALIVGMAGSGVFGAFRSGTILSGIAGGYYTQMGSPCTGLDIVRSYTPWGMWNWGGLMWLWIPMLIASVVIAGFGTYLMRSSWMKNVEVGVVLLLVAAVLALPTAFGFVAGSFLLALAGVLGLFWFRSDKTSARRLG